MASAVKKQTPDETLGRCFMPLKEQLSADFLQSHSQLAVRVYHKGFSGTSDDLSQLRVAINGFFLRRLEALFSSSDEGKRFQLKEGFTLSSEPNQSHGLEETTHCRRKHIGEICIARRKPRNGEGDSQSEPSHVSAQPVISLETRKKQECPPFPEYLRLARQAVFADVDRLEDPSAEDVLDAAIKFQMLLVPWKTSLKLSFNPERHSSLKDGVFVVYNAVRLSNILDKYQEGVKQGLYLPVDSNIDQQLFQNQELELLSECCKLPSVPEQILDVRKDIRTHLFPEYLLGLARKISLYYRNNQILKEPLPHLLPSIQAKATLISAALNQLKLGLELLDIQIPRRM